MISGLNQAELVTVLNAPKFQERLVEASDLTQDGFEAGFMVTRNKNTGVVDISEVHHPDTNYSEALEAYTEEILASGGSPEEQFIEFLSLLDPEADPAGLLPHLDMGRLIANEDVSGVRTDLAFVGHTHPLLHTGRRKISEFLLPSPTDIINYGDQASANPNLIAGVIVTHRDVGGAALRLWKLGTEDALQQVQNAERNQLGRSVSEQQLASLGLSTAVLTFDRHKGSVHPDTLGNLDKLFAPPAAA